MLTLKLQCNTTEFDSFPPEECEFTQFEINERSMSVKALDANEVELSQTEISIEDAVKLAKLILTLNN